MNAFEWYDILYIQIKKGGTIMSKQLLQILKRFVSLTVIFCMITAILPVVSFADDSQKPTDLTEIYVDDFSDGEVAPNITMHRNFTGNPADTLTESDGTLTFERKKWIWYTDSNYGEPAVRIYPNAEHTPITGKLFIEFNLAKTREVARLRFCDSMGNYVTQISWEGDNFNYTWRDTSLATKSKDLVIPASDTVKISLCADFGQTRPRFYLWINDNLEVNGGYSASDLSAANFEMFYIYTLLYSGYSRAGTLKVSDLGIYSLNSDEGLPPEIDINDEQTVESDMTALTKERLLSAPLVDGYLIDHLNIDSITSGTSGSEITWVSSHEDIIATDGTLTRPTEDTEVTVTAVVKCKTVQKKKTFTFKVPSKNNNINGLPGDIAAIYYDNFADGVIADNISTHSFVTSKPADTLVEENSRLTFTRKQDVPKDDESYGKPGVVIDLSNGGEPLEGRLFTEFIFSKTCDIAGFTIGDSSGGKLTEVIWSGNSFNMSYRDSSLVSKTKSEYVASSDSVKVSIYSDFSGNEPVYSLWLNNEKKLDNVISLSSFDSAVLTSLSLSTFVNGSYTNTGSYSVDNLGVYSVSDSFVDEKGPDDGTPDMSNEDRVEADLDAITEEALLSVPKTDEG